MSVSERQLRAVADDSFQVSLAPRLAAAGVALGTNSRARGRSCKAYATGARRSAGQEADAVSGY
jgi:hypothetical protein